MSKHVLIIGGGVIGLCTAYYCVQRGFTVTVLERNSAQRDGCSFGNAGLVVPSHFVPLAAPGAVALALKWMWQPTSPFYLKPRLSWDLFSWSLRFWGAANAEHVRRAAPLLRDLSFASRRCYEELTGSLGENFGLVKRGLLMLCKEPNMLDEETKTAELARSLDIPADVLDARQTAARDPDVCMDVAGSVYFPLDCHLAPQRLMAALQSRLLQLDVRFIWNREAEGWRVDNRRVRAVNISDGDGIEADEFVVCGGSWSPPLVRGLGLKIPLQAGKGYNLTLQKPRQLPRICSILSEARVAVTPMGGALRVGGTMEIAGLNEDINPARVRGVVEAFCRYFPEFRREDFDTVPPWCGLRPCSPDGLPFVGRTQKFENLSLATGHAMMGMSLGPVTGNLMAKILSGEKPAWDIRLLSPDRYA